MLSSIRIEINVWGAGCSAAFTARTVLDRPTREVNGDPLPKLRAGIEYMDDHMDEMRKLNPKNGWGDAQGALAYLEAIRKACEEHPKAKVYVSC